MEYIENSKRLRMGDDYTTLRGGWQQGVHRDAHAPSASLRRTCPRRSRRRWGLVVGGLCVSIHTVMTHGRPPASLRTKTRGKQSP